MISYAQNFEDVILERFFKDKCDGFYVDIGAMDPVEHSVTKHFYDKGWKGVNIEPNPIAFKKLNEQRTRDLNLQIAVSNIIGKISFNAFQKNNVDTGLGLSSTKNIDYSDIPNVESEFFVPIEVDCITLDELHRRYNIPKDYDFLKIDVEGAEYDILSVATFENYKPKIIIVEATLPLTQITNYDQWERFILTAGYEFVYFDGLNRFYLRNDLLEYKHLFSYPPCVFDNFELYKVVKQREELSHTREVLSSQINQLQQQVNSLYNSYSWKITAPLRWGLRVFKKITGKLKAASKRVIKIPRKILRSSIIFFGRIFIKVNIIKKPVKFILKKLSPRLHDRIYRMVTMPSEVYGYNNSINKTSEFIMLSPRARRIYEDLKREIDKRNNNI